MNFIIKLFSTIFFLGYLPAGGTFASLVAVPIVILLSHQYLTYTIFLLLTIIFSIPISSQAEKMFFKKDDRRIVIDEFCGFLLAMYGISIEHRLTIFVGFVLYRMLDIIKPGFRSLQKLSGGIGIVIDDLISGIITNIFLRLIF